MIKYGLSKWEIFAIVIIVSSVLFALLDGYDSILPGLLGFDINITDEINNVLSFFNK